MSSQKKLRRSKQNVADSCLKLLEECLPRFADGHAVEYQDLRSSQLARETYPDPNTFYRDCRAIVAELNRIRPWLEVLGIPLPLVKYADGRLRISIRKFVDRATSLRDRKKLLAQNLVDYTFLSDPNSRNYLVPRSGTTYLGFGTTVLAVAESLFAHTDNFNGFGVATANIEVLLRYYVSAHTHGKEYFILNDAGRIDWAEGCVLPNDDEAVISTSIISFEAMNRQGLVYADTEPKRNAIQAALKRTKKRLILVADSSKFRDDRDQYVIDLNGLDIPEKYLFSNGHPPRGYKKPKGVTLIDSSPPQPATEHSRRKSK